MSVHGIVVLLVTLLGLMLSVKLVKKAAELMQVTEQSLI